MAPSPGQQRGAVNRLLVPGLVAGLALLCDQLTKGWIVRALGPEPGERQIFLIGDWLSFVYVRNTGVAFGLFQHMPQVFTVTSLAITAAAIYVYLFHLPHDSAWVKLSMGMIVGGALGNVIDRIRLNYVVDFIKVGWWPVFNVADSAVTVGVVVLACYLLFATEPETAPPPRDDALLSALLGQDVEADQPALHRARPGMTDSGRRVSSDQ